ncbi:ABC transporter ATP-binding protein [Gottschalkia acidurici 9a]|uniref:ABC transporter ATP-binding protein n=1 Tax=Gottschalkia acidurici (strain ATCC 7906 / DSM 604 / BCRC 14475 / CIP 104303 / KCTC 5404 / NCIMB 10678 / 9a) TaxID=1128398 RepID=K0AYE0_GOTA9|nr:ABC transporter ATP-binding protein [Gottschalkia acidurici]AFS78798.1 ABC transporter ATP-binding protein [Gottschalkia acidurici 9a]
MTELYKHKFEESEECPNILTFSDVTFNYKCEENDLLQNLNFNIREGEFVSIIGPSGCGKSTLFRLITGLEKNIGGTIYISGENIMSKSGTVGYMPQKDLLVPWRTILQNACLPLEIKGIPKNEAILKGREYLEIFGLNGYEDRYPKELSGGMKQRVSFLRTILTGADLLLLDEPFSALDAITKISLQEWLQEQWIKLKNTILFITHDVEEAIFLSSRILIVTDKPITQLKEVEIPLEYPRNRSMLGREDLVKIKEQLIDELKQKVEI